MRHVLIAGRDHANTMKHRTKKSLGSVLLACVVGAALWAPGGAAAAEPWEPGAFGLKEQRRGDPGEQTSVRWQNVPLARAVRRLADASGRTIFLDRRLDPGTAVSLVGSGDAATLLGQLSNAGAERPGPRWGQTTVGGVLYLGPANAAYWLRTVHARATNRLAGLPAEQRRRWRHRQPAAWPKLAQPRQIIARRLAAANLTLSNPEAIPHDRWRRGSLPRARVGEHLTLLLAGFGLEWRPGPGVGEATVAPIERPVSITAVHTAPPGSSLTAEGYQPASEHTQLRVEGRVWTLTGRAEDHQRLAALLSPSQDAAGAAPERQTSEPAGWADKRITLAVTDRPAKAVLQSLAGALGVSLVGGDAPRLSRAVSLDLRGATIEELLAAISKEVGLAITLTADAIVVAPAAPG
ncbi:MAG: hypothetical protein AAF790_12270 [Planctomycetota bacterium]